MNELTGGIRKITERGVRINGQCRSSASVVNLLPLQRAALFLSAYWAGLPACLEQEWERG